MRHTLMLNLDDRHAQLLDDLSHAFPPVAEDTARFAIRSHMRVFRQKPDVLVPEFKPSAAKRPPCASDDYEPF